MKFRSFACSALCLFLLTAAGQLGFSSAAQAESKASAVNAASEMSHAEVPGSEVPSSEPPAVKEEKKENIAEQGKRVKPEDDNLQAKDVRPQDEQKELGTAVDAAGSQPRIGIAKPWQTGMIPAASPVQERLIHFHNGMLILITVISLIVLALLIYVCVRFNAKRNPVPSKTTHNVMVEVIWTVIPVLLVIAILIPSLKNLYYMDHSEVSGKADVTIKIIGYQWYWNYEYPESGFAFDSYIIKEEDLKPEKGQIRLLSVDNEVVVPVNKKILLQLTGGDVIHSWAMPAFGVKMDAVPGHLNETWFEATQVGLYYGQCSELCGVNHGFMPINVRVVTEEEYKAWLEQAKKKFASVPAEQRYAALNQ